MNRKGYIVFFSTLLVIGVILFYNKRVKSDAYYEKEFHQNKKDFYFMLQSIGTQLKKNDRLFRYTVENTGKRFVEYPFSDDSVRANFNVEKLSEENQIEIVRRMDNNDLMFVTVYRDSAKFYVDDYVYIIIYDSHNAIHHGREIDTNVYFVGEKKK